MKLLPLQLQLRFGSVEKNALPCRHGHTEGRRSDGKCRRCYEDRRARRRAALRKEAGIVLRCEAVADGREEYTGQECKQGHGRWRRVKTGECVVCYRDRHAKWQEQLAVIEARRARGELTGRKGQRARAAARRRAACAARRELLRTAPRQCLRCERVLSEADFRCTPRTKHPQWCVRCRSSFSDLQRAKRTGKLSEGAARRKLAERRQKPKWAKAKDLRAIYAYARFLRSVGIDCEVDHIVPLRGSDVCGLHAPGNLRVCLSRDNRSKSAELIPGAAFIPSEFENPVFVSWVRHATA
jgi:hypothetical protein